MAFAGGLTVESRFDDQLVKFDPEESYPVSATALSLADNAILTAKAYRASVDKMVQDLSERKRGHAEKLRCNALAITAMPKFTKM